MISRRCYPAVFILLLVLVLGGCATRKLSTTEQENLYHVFRSTYGRCNSTGIKARASLYYTSENKGHRTTMTIWGDYGSPLRLDVRAGIGAYIAHIHEDTEGLIAFYPDQKTAYSHIFPTRAVQLLGLPFPFALKDLAGLIAGCYQSLIPQTYDSVSSEPETGALLYIFNYGPISSLKLTEKGIPTEISGRGDFAWRMELSSYEQDATGKMLPDKIAVYTDKGDKAILRIKSREYTAAKWPEDSMTMELPDGTEKIRLDRNGYVKID